VRSEFERGRLQQKAVELQNELDVKKRELEDLNGKHTHVLSQNSKLMEQLKLFEQESYEIQNKIRRGFEVERENENIGKVIEDLRNTERDLLRQLED